MIICDAEKRALAGIEACRKSAINILFTMASLADDASSAKGPGEGGADVVGVEDSSTPEQEHIRAVENALSKARMTDKPLTEETADSVMEDMMGVLKLVTRERNAYLEEREYLDDLTAREDNGVALPLESKVQGSPRSEEELLLEESRLLEKLKSIREAKKSLLKKRRNLAKVEQQLDELEVRQGLHRNQATASKSRESDRLESFRSELEYSKQRLASLTSVNVCNVAFFIWHDGPFGTINSFRLGRCPSILVEWSEVNCAWGQTALLLATIAHKLSFTFSKYRIIPMGSASKIARTGRERNSYDLHSNGGTRMFSRNTFGLGMVAFLDCLQEICRYVTELDRSFLFPHVIDGDKVGEYSIKLVGASSDEWTHALKCMLSNLKWLLAWSANHLNV